MTEIISPSLERSDLQPRPLPAGGTEIVLQRHGRYVRDESDPNVGSLTPDAVTEERRVSAEYFEAMLDQIPPDEADSIDVLILASDTQYGGETGGRRSFETAELVLASAKSVLRDRDLQPNQHIINLREPQGMDAGPRPEPMLREPQMFDYSPEFVDYLRQKYGADKEFWIAFEEDRESAMRKELDAEGPDDLADRMAFEVALLNAYAEWYHRNNPGRRLVVWATTHYDTISPYVKRDILGEQKETYVGVDYGAGLVIDIAPDGQASTSIAGREYDVAIA